MVVIKHLLCTIIIFLGCIELSTAMIEGLYCGKRNCYDVLGVSRDEIKQEIGKSYRRLAKKFHPDMHRSKRAKEKAEEMFKLIATAYEILKDEDSRKDYDYMLDNPEEVYRHYFHYYRTRMAPKVDIRIVIAVSITVISVVQYISACHRYSTAINYLVTVPKYRIRALDIAKQEGLINGNTKTKKGKRTKEELREEEDGIIRTVIEDNMDIVGGYAKPKVTEVLWIQLVLLPYTIIMYIWFHIKWIYKFNIKGEEYGTEEKFYLIKKYMKCSNTYWHSIETSEKDKYLKLELWKKEKFESWRLKEEEAMRIKLAEMPKFRRNRRQLRNHGPGQITFED